MTPISTNDLMVSVIVPVYNGEEFLSYCLPAIFASDHPKIEVLVVDDCSTDGSAEYGRRAGGRVLSMPFRSGPAAARNLAVGEAKGDILLFVDADVVIKRDTVSKVASCFATRPDLSALFGSYDDDPGEPNFLSQYKNLYHHYVHQNSNPEASTFWAGLGAIRRDVFLSLGGFDAKKFAVPSIEDIELGLRMRAAGHRISLEKDIQVKHLKRWETMSLLRTDIYCRALPWSRLILSRNGMVNDLNLKTSDRISAVLVALALLAAPLGLLDPLLAFIPLLILAVVFLVNRQLIAFFARHRGGRFAAMVFCWQLLFFFYSGVAFVYCWFSQKIVSHFTSRAPSELRN